MPVAAHSTPRRIHSWKWGSAIASVSAISIVRYCDGASAVFDSVGFDNHRACTNPVGEQVEFYEKTVTITF